MDVSIGDLLTIEGKKYITLEMLNYMGNKYIFTNLVMDDEENVTDEFYVFEVVDDTVDMIEGSDLLNVLLPKFQKMLEDDLKNMVNE